MREFVLVDATALSGEALLGLVEEARGPEDAFLTTQRGLSELYLAAVDRGFRDDRPGWIPVLRGDGDLVVRGVRFTAAAGLPETRNEP